MPRALQQKTVNETSAERKNRRYANEATTAFLNRSAADALYGGIPIDVAADIFCINDADLKDLIDKGGVEPIGKSGHAILYSIKDLSEVCVSPKWSEEEWELVLSRRNFPAQLIKEFWNAKKARQDFLLSAGDLWHTTEIIDLLSEVFKTVAMGVRLITDNVERETTLSVEQRNLINGYIDTALNNANKLIKDKYEKRVDKERLARYQELTDERILNGSKKRSRKRPEKEKQSQESSEGILTDL